MLKKSVEIMHCQQEKKIAGGKLMGNNHFLTMVITTATITI